jgi:alkylhydroperoxidase family enzyme
MENLAPELRARLEEIQSSGQAASTDFYQILAYHTPTVTARVARPPTAHMEGLLGPRLTELLRLRSAQLGGCEKCAGISYGDVIDENDGACMISGNDEAFTERERLALQYMTLMHTDHHSIDDDVYAKLHTIFTTAEIIELAVYCSHAVGAHRLVHTLDLLGTDPPAIAFDPSDIV